MLSSVHFTSIVHMCVRNHDEIMVNSVDPCGFIGVHYNVEQREILSAYHHGYILNTVTVTADIQSLPVRRNPVS